VSHVVKYKSVSITLHPYRHSSGREYWRFKAAGQPISRSTLEKAKREALKHAQTLYRGNLDLSTLTPEQSRAVRRMIEADPSCRLVDEFLVWKTRTKPEKATETAVAEFLTIKEKNAGRSTQNLRTLRKHLNPIAVKFAGVSLAAITVHDIEAHLIANPNHGNRTRKNMRASIVTFFRWCESREYLPEGKTVAEKVEAPITSYKVPETYEPEEMRIMLENVKPGFLAWLATGGFAGVRTDEIKPIAGSRKSPLDWKDFKWDRDLIIIRPETSKTGHRRVIPIQPVLRAWIYPIRKESGPVHEEIAPTKTGRGKGAIAETKRLGALVGGWRPNALRDSFISYRAAKVGLAKTAMEAGNSEAEAKASYNDAKGEDDADRWFGLLPKCYSKKRPSQNPTERK